MLCCLLSALMAGNLAAAGRMAFVRNSAITLLGLMITGGIAIVTAPAVAEHAGHYATRAAANDRSILEELMAQPLCSGPNATLASVTP
jgi:F0F1-type ATP synthase membrane subunit c/vacuolar-type H+-ATPase subunit K